MLKLPIFRINKKVKNEWLNFILPIKYSIIKAGIVNQYTRKIKVIGSIITFPARIKYAHPIKESLLRQTYYLYSINLYLSEEEFRCIPLPKKLVALCENELKFIYCTDNLWHNINKGVHFNA